MGDEVVFMVRGKTREVCQQYVDLVCQLIGAVPRGRITDTMPPGWVGRAVLTRDDEAKPPVRPPS